MTRYHDGDHDRPTGRDLARDVLADDELADYYQSLRNRPRSRLDRNTRHDRISEDGYDQNGNWHPGHDPEEWR